MSVADLLVNNDYNLNCASLNSNGDIGVAGNLNVAGTTNLNGPVNFNMNGNFSPSTDNTDDLGTSTKRWRSAYIGTDINMDGTLNSTNGQCIQATGTIFTTGIVGADQSVNGGIINCQNSDNQLVFTQSNGSSIPTIINSVPASSARIYTIPDKGADGNFAITDSSNNLTVNQLNYTTLNPPISSTSRAYLYRLVGTQVLGSIGNQNSVIPDTTILENPANDVTHEGSGIFRINTNGLYSCYIKVQISGTTGSNIGSVIVNNDESYFYGQNVSGSDVALNASSSSSAILNCTAGQSISFGAFCTASNNGQSISQCDIQLLYIGSG